ncbi:histidine phosphatase family protein [Microbacterium rhizomatis]|uniref:Histidine phosphatase family protein n=1 Tax=Microbacterium rhizomatis TaxID=1631477 RepID=A0A5J5J471_9MICO|nr:histidine phosphatase family protein [Microbacterium rhizomatis]KAA9110810.1 histidine phosphatase family protein [Microbacterium rhizomatis]
MTILTLVRHGETDWNRDRRIQGTTDIPLNDTGRQQARDAATALAAELDGPVVIVSSDLARARETAQIIAAQLELPEPRQFAELRERAYGVAEGISSDEFFSRWGDWHTAEVPGAETRPHLRARALGALRRVSAQARRDTAPVAASLVVVTHGALIREVIRHATREEFPADGERLANGSATTFLLERERLRLLSYSGVVA